MNKTDTRIYIIGAGFAGQMIARDLLRKKIFGTVASFFDDDENLIGKSFDGIPVFGPVESIASVIRAGQNDEAIIATPSAGTEKIKKIYDILINAGFTRIKILPSVSQIVEGKAHLIQARDINPLDVLGRTPIVISLKESLSYLKGKRVLITGAGGSIGSELARQLLEGGAERLYLFGHGENSIVNIYRELHILQNEGVGEKATVVPIIGDMKDREYTDYIIGRTHADVIFHCAAYKHVPMMEENPVAVIENNVLGTKNLLDASLAHNVERFVLISTDKAVTPVSVYGVSKMLCEKLVLKAAKSAGNNQAFMFVRFGNVLGSRGSILPLFMEQINNGGPVTVTDPEMERFFMTIPEACSLVLQTGGVGKNAESYLLDMGESIKIIDLARQIIKFSGFEPEKDIAIKIIGPRPGERLEEPLWLKEENPQPTEYKKILKLKNIESKTLDGLLEKIMPVVKFNSEKKELFRNKEVLLRILRDEVPSLNEFYTKMEQEGTKQKLSAKVVL
ncbi:polysaccharide biosynthesis protein [Treponema rectale]|uniref:FlaA1/EpsC-like NDP-sugar epimerase n=1 Tax=Treponema rectale TaxID=744512 RepID=A0A840SGG7_9SPIR|nr:nucleoside-diphosphate sugar epimerase/dehydratase [Treponema rectale]MBB5218531.1 FlaA1/EpsC-like NDP-sugar epimerase [Treponema rectale]QOS39785.1 polysaccharide biosynthesis protein [Treponema rectale]